MISSLNESPKVMFRSCELHHNQKNLITHNLKLGRQWFLHMIKMVLLRLTACQMILLRLLHTTKSLFTQYCTHKFENFRTKKLGGSTIMRGHMLRNQLPTYSLSIHGEYCTNFLTTSIWVHLISAIFQNQKNYFVEIVLEVLTCFRWL